MQFWKQKIILQPIFSVTLKIEFAACVGKVDLIVVWQCNLATRQQLKVVTLAFRVTQNGAYQISRIRFTCFEYIAQLKLGQSVCPKLAFPFPYWSVTIQEFTTFFCFPKLDIHTCWEKQKLSFSVSMALPSQLIVSI